MPTAETSLGEILVATDFSTSAGMAVARAARLAGEHGARLGAVHVLPADVLPADMKVDPERVGDALRAHAQWFADPIPVDVAVRRGSAAVEIVAEAMDRNVGLVVLGAHGAHGEDWRASLFPGGTAENVVRLSATPVLLVKRHPTAAYRTVILGVDDSAASADAARFGAILTPSAEHIAVHVCTVVGENLMRIYGAGDAQIERLRKVSTAETHRRIVQLASAFGRPLKEVSIATGHAPTRLVEKCDSVAADLIVTGTGARSPVAYALLGSVAQHVMRQARCDVLIVPVVAG